MVRTVQFTNYSPKRIIKDPHCSSLASHKILIYAVTNRTGFFVAFGLEFVVAQYTVPPISGMTSNSELLEA